MDEQPSSTKKRLLDEQQQQQPKDLFKDYGPKVPVPIGAINPDVLGKATANLLFGKLAELAYPSLKSEMFWKQNRTLCDGKITIDQIFYRIEVKWSSIQLQDRKNNQEGKLLAHYRWEFGNIKPENFDILVCFGHFSLQATATQENLEDCIKNFDSATGTPIWNLATTSVDTWLQGCSVWIISSKELQLLKSNNTLHCKVCAVRGDGYKKPGSINMYSKRIWGGNLNKIKECFDNVLKSL